MNTKYNGTLLFCNSLLNNEYFICNATNIIESVKVYITIKLQNIAC